jgi:hypothetical protein
VIRPFGLFSLALLLSACVSWETPDIDGDGVLAQDGDCDDLRADIGPNAVEIWYDGVDQNCDGNDADQDGDGFDSWQIGGPDCWDDPGAIRENFDVLTTEWDQPTAFDVHPDAAEIYYDGVDANCDTLDDFDQDGDGYSTSKHANRSDELGDDCVDGSDFDDPNDAGFAAADVHPGIAQDACYDGTNADCDTDTADTLNTNGDYRSDFDCDNDGWMQSEECDDTDESIEPNDDPDAWYDCVDANCDGNDGDMDGDGYVPDDYAAACPGWANLSAHVGTGDCWDDPGETPSDFTPINGYSSTTAAAVTPDSQTVEIFYDAIDQNCDGLSDFDADLDTVDTTDFPNRAGVFGEDCNDANGDINPNVNENCSTTDDDDCDGDTNDLGAESCTTFYQDADQDGYGDVASSVYCHCEAKIDASSTIYRSATTKDDCDDSEATTYPGADEYCDGVNNDCDSETDEDSALDVLTWYADTDSDNYGDPAVTDIDCYKPTGYVADNTDCDDGESTTYPGASEFCDNVNNDCDSETDEDDSLDVLTWYADTDSDGFGDNASTDTDCYQPTGYVADNTDCDDNEITTYPGADEYCDTVNNDCDGETDEDHALDAPTWYADTDTDGYGNNAASDVECYQPTGYVSDNTDCDDSEITTYPGADEYCDTVNNDCDSETDEDHALDASTWYADTDTDGYGDPAVSDIACYQPTGYVADNTDCDDSEITTYPGADEYCDTVNNDCDSETDEDDALDVSTWYADTDMDGYGDPAVSDIDCDQPTGYVADNTDCDDGAKGINPGATEVCDAGDVNEDCDSGADDNDPDGSPSSTLYYTDSDADGEGSDSATGVAYCDPPSGVVADNSDCDDGDITINTSGTEVCDSADVDEDCDGGADDSDPEGTPSGGTTDGYTDADGDGYGDETATAVAYCDLPSGVVTDNTDCDDTAVGTNPGAAEICDSANVSEDCDSGADDNDPDGTPATTLYYTDSDADGEGSDTATGVAYCDPPSGVVADNSDCDDADNTINTSATEVCDGADVDEDCDGGADDSDPEGTPSSGTTDGYPDVDADTYGDSSATATAYCDLPSTSVTDNTDCSDGDDSTYPGATEVCDDGVVNDCNGTTGSARASCALSGTVSASTANSKFTGEQADDYAGSNVSYVGDINNDGNDDLLIGAQSADAAGTNSGAAYVIYGPVSSNFSLSSADVQITGEAAGDHFGDPVSEAGDMNNDGFDDFLVTAYFENGARGSTYLFYGPLSSGTLSASAADAKVSGVSASDYSGMGMDGAGDVDNDGNSDVLIGSSYSAPNGSFSGTAYLFNGPISGSLSVSSADATITGDAGDMVGHSVAGAGDTNGDGFADILIGAIKDDDGGTDGGAAHLFLGPVSGSLSASSSDVKHTAEAGGDRAGQRTAGAGDVNNDGYADYLIGATMESTIGVRSGAAYLIYGSVSASSAALSAADAKFTGEAAGDYAGHDVASALDIDGDGNDDILIGSEEVDSTSTDSGSAYLFYGPVSGTVSLSTADFIITGENSGDYAGGELAGVGDIDGDGNNDLLITAVANDDAFSNAGAAYLFYGSSY